MNPIFEVLRQSGVLRRNSASMRGISKLSAAQLTQLAEEVTLLTERRPQASSPDPMALHTCSLTLAGDPSGSCSALECRLKAVEKLSRFAAMYSNGVRIPNFLTSYTTPDSGLELTKSRFYDDIAVLARLEPLLNCGLADLVNPRFFLCDTHAKELRKTQLRFSRAEGVLASYYSRRLKGGEILRLPDGYLVSYDTGAESTDCDGGFYGGLTKTIASVPGFSEPSCVGDRANLSASVARRIGVHEQMAARVRHHVEFPLLLSEIEGISFVGDSDDQVRFLSRVFPSPKLDRRNTILAKHLTTLLPFLEDVPISVLVKLRKNEDDAFIAYRRAMSNAIDESSNVERSFSSRDAAAIYHDIVEPELSALTRRVSVARRHLLGKATRKSIGLLGAVTIGLYSGMLSAEISHIVAAVGLAKGVDVIGTWLDAQDATEPIREHKLYFLWRVRAAARA